jgi:hypothetical protein
MIHAIADNFDNIIKLMMEKQNKEKRESIKNYKDTTNMKPVTNNTIH